MGSDIKHFDVFHEIYTWESNDVTHWENVRNVIQGQYQIQLSDKSSSKTFRLIRIKLFSFFFVQGESIQPKSGCSTHQMLIEFLKLTLMDI